MDVLELRYYLRKFTMVDLAQGLQPAKIPTGINTFELYAPPTLQYRIRRKVMPEGAPSPIYEWGEWLSVPWVREGEELQLNASDALLRDPPSTSNH